MDDIDESSRESSTTATHQRSQHEVVFSDPSQPIDLNDFRNVLIRQEETIIFALIERAQFAKNDAIYTSMKQTQNPVFTALAATPSNSNSIMSNSTLAPHPAATLPDDQSFLDFLMSETEKLHALVRRYTSPDEQPFYSTAQGYVLPRPILPTLDYPEVLKPNQININADIRAIYLHQILAQITDVATEDPTSYGSAATCDIAVLQALSRRIHFGKYIAEAKFQASRMTYERLIRANDAKGIMATLTNAQVEKNVFARVKLKASTYGQDICDLNVSNHLKVDPQRVAEIYRDYVMPLTKKVQVAYLLQRLDHALVAYYVPNSSRSHVSAQDLVQTVFPGTSETQQSACSSIDEALDHVSSNQCAYAVVPLEDSMGGMVKETQLALIQSKCIITSQFIWKHSRYVVIMKQKDCDQPTGLDQTCLYLQVAHETGGLVSVLNLFEQHQVNLIGLQSIPCLTERWKYGFFIEVDGHRQDPAIEHALEALWGISSTIQWLGSFSKLD